jgi:hypothetical protein
MKMPRFTIRRLMGLVAVVALLIPGSKACSIGGGIGTSGPWW